MTENAIRQDVRLSSHSSEITAFIARHSDRIPLEEMSSVITAVEENLHGHVAHLQSRLPGMTVEDRDDLLLVDSGLPTDTFNKVCRARLSDADADRRIAEAVEHFRARGRPFAWWVGPGCQPLDIESRLENQGLCAFETEPGMVMEIELLAKLMDEASNLDVRRVSAKRELDHFIGVLNTCGHPPDPAVGTFS